MKVVGLSSGTSYDGIDVAAADLWLDGDTLQLHPMGSRVVDYDDETRAAIADVLPPAAATARAFCLVDTRVGQAFADAACAAVDDLPGGDADLVVSHGQTIYHWVEGHGVEGTLQMGQPAWIAERTGLPVVADLRARDVAAGGHGAPLVSLVDVLLLGAEPRQPRAALNLGGIANVTVVSRGAPPVAFDTGPANTLIDAAVAAASGGRETYDTDGRRAGRGEVHPGLLRRLLADPYYGLPPPKTTGRERFHGGYLRGALADVGDVTGDDIVATATALAAATVAEACRALGVREVVASGGGTRNPTLMAMLAEELGDVAVRPIDEFGLPSAAKEAYCFAVLGFLTVHGLTATLPSCTGARHPSVLGAVLPGRRGFPAPPKLPRSPRRLQVVEAPSA